MTNNIKEKALYLNRQPRGDERRRVLSALSDVCSHSDLQLMGVKGNTETTPRRNPEEPKAPITEAKKHWHLPHTVGGQKVRVSYQYHLVRRKRKKIKNESSEYKARNET